MKTRRLFGTLALWIPTVLLGIVFVLQGSAKLESGSGWIEKFQGYGYPPAFCLFIGVVELVGGIGLFIPRLARYAALALAVVMVGACVTHMLHSELPNVVATFVFTLVLSGIAYARGFRPGQGPKETIGIREQN